jgi:RNA polymerase sigma factor (sigma-70 family)
MVIGDDVALTRPDGVPATAPMSFEELFHRERVRLFQAMCLVTADRHEAEELTQDAFVRVYARWQHVGGLDDPTGYLYRTAMNGFRSRYRRTKVAVRRIVPSVARDDIAAVEQHADLLRDLRALTPSQRAAVVLLDLLELSSDEAGELLGMRSGTVRVHASRARARLRAMAGDGDD